MTYTLTYISSFPLEAKLYLPSHLIALCKIEQRKKRSASKQPTPMSFASICFGAFCSVLAIW